MFSIDISGKQPPIFGIFCFTCPPTHTGVLFHSNVEALLQWNLAFVLDIPNRNMNHEQISTQLHQWDVVKEYLPRYSKLSQ